MKKSNIIPIVFGAVVMFIIMMLLKRCGYGGSKTTNDTISVRIDTVYTEAKTDTHYIPKPYKVIVVDKVEIPANTDAFVLELANKEAIIADREDTIKALRDYLSVKYYSKTHRVKYGTLTIKDTLFKNSIYGRGISLNQRIPEIVKTFTIEAKPRTIFYLGGDIYGNFNNPIWGVGANASLKFRNDKIYSLGAVVPQNSSVVYTFGFKIPIRLNKK